MRISREKRTSISTLTSIWEIRQMEVNRKTKEFISDDDFKRLIALWKLEEILRRFNQRKYHISVANM